MRAPALIDSAQWLHENSSRLFADAEAAEDLTKEFVAADISHHFAEFLLRIPQFEGGQLTLLRLQLTVRQIQGLAARRSASTWRARAENAPGPASLCPAEPTSNAGSAGRPAPVTAEIGIRCGAAQLLAVPADIF